MNVIAFPSANGRFGTWSISLGGVLFATLLWLPWNEVDFSFSGPTRIVTHYGLLNSWETTTRYASRRVDKSTILATEPLQADEMTWEHRGVFDQDTVVVKVRERTTTVHYLALAGSIAASLGLVWLAVYCCGQVRQSK